MRESIRNEIVRLHYGGRLTAPHCKTAGDRPQECGLACWRITNNSGLVQWNSRARDGRAYWILSPSTWHNCWIGIRT